MVICKQQNCCRFSLVPISTYSNVPVTPTRNRRWKPIPENRYHKPATGMKIEHCPIRYQKKFITKLHCQMLQKLVPVWALISGMCVIGIIPMTHVPESVPKTHTQGQFQGGRGGHPQWNFCPLPVAPKKYKIRPSLAKIFCQSYKTSYWEATFSCFVTF